MSHKIITIGRQFGSNGLIIGQKLAERLGIVCYDKNLIKLACEHTDIPYDQLKLVDEKKESPWRYQTDIDDGLDRQYRYWHIDEMLFDLQSEVIKNLAATEDCIFIGRCANHVLEDEPRLRSVFLYAPKKTRIQTVMDRYEIEEKEARSLIKKVDKDRSYYYNYYTDQKWDDLTSYHMAYDTAAMSIDEIVDLLEVAYKQL